MFKSCRIIKNSHHAYAACIAIDVDIYILSIKQLLFKVRYRIFFIKKKQKYTIKCEKCLVFYNIQAE